MVFVVTLIGGSNGSHVMAADLGADPNFKVRLVTRNPSKWSKQVTLSERDCWPSDGLPFVAGSWTDTIGTLDMVVGWDRLAEALQGADLCMMICPVLAHREFLEKIVPALPPHPIFLGTSYAQGGFDWHCREVFKKYPKQAVKCVVFGMKNFPYLCKASEYGKSVKLYGRFPVHKVALAPELPQHRETITAILGAMLKKPIVQCAFPTCTIGTTNQVLHPGIFSQIWKGHKFGDNKQYDEQHKFYAAVRMPAAREMVQMFYFEMPALATALQKLYAEYPHAVFDGVDFHHEVKFEWSSGLVLSLPRPMVYMMTWLINVGCRFAMSENVRLDQVRAPMTPIEQEDGSKKWAPNAQNRMFFDDVPYGLCVLLGIGELLDVPLPTTVHLIKVNQRMMGKEYIADKPNSKGKYVDTGKHWGESGAPQIFGVSSKAELADFLAWDRAKEIAGVTGAQGAALRAAPKAKL